MHPTLLRTLFGGLVGGVSLLSANSPCGTSHDCRWTETDTTGSPSGRHENGFVAFQGKAYLIGGRGQQPVNVFDPVASTWETRSLPPMEMHHFQAVVYGEAIYIVGAMTGPYPRETPLSHIWIYHPHEDRWEEGAEIPEARRRGAAGAVLYDDKIYLSCGIEFGHSSGTNNYFDSYCLKTGEWEVLTKAPHIRDHFSSVVHEDRLYNIGGRNTSVHYEDNFGAFFAATIPQIDVYDFSTGKWFTLKEPLPIPTAAAGIIVSGDCILYMGGEGERASAYNETQCLDLSTGKWSQLAPMSLGRHGTGAVNLNNAIYMAAGSPNKGGGNLQSIEMFSSDHDWQPLFDGKSLSGWSVKASPKDQDRAYWYVEDGAIVCNTRGATDHGYIWLQSDATYGDFELRLQFQAASDNKGNSGVQIRSRWNSDATVDGDGNARGWLDGPQVDIHPPAPWRNGFIYDETRGHRRWIFPDLPDWNIDKDTYSPRRVVYFAEDQAPHWNDLRIRARGTRITTWVNNIQVADYDGSGVLDDEAHRAHDVGMLGHIALQLHKTDSNHIRFRFIEIRKL